MVGGGLLRCVLVLGHSGHVVYVVRSVGIEFLNPGRVKGKPFVEGLVPAEEFHSCFIYLVSIWVVYPKGNIRHWDHDFLELSGLKANDVAGIPESGGVICINSIFALQGLPPSIFAFCPGSTFRELAAENADFSSRQMRIFFKPYCYLISSDLLDLCFSPAFDLLFGVNFDGIYLVALFEALPPFFFLLRHLIDRGIDQDGVHL